MATSYKDRKIADPLLNIGDERYYEAAGQGKLLVKKCADCGEVHHYPRSICPFCFSDKVSWHETKGTGTVYTYSVTRRGGGANFVPYCIAYVKLDEGVSLMTNIVDCDLDTVRCGQKVKVVFKKSEGGVSIPMFTPA